MTSPPRPLHVYDTLSRQRRPLEPLEPGKIKMYVCGVTVYDYTHIGHARTFIFFDVVQRTLRHFGYDLTFVRNHTDVDDKIIARAAERGIDPLALSHEFILALEEDMARLDVAQADIEPKVSTHIDEIVEMISILMKKDFAYSAPNGDVYYRVGKFKGYGKLSKRQLEDMEAGRSGRVSDDDDSQKEHPFDFALWKHSKPGEPSWEAPWGAGRPGWHIECSAMSHKHLGDEFDIHGGGMDLTFPHHENEIAQSEACTGHAPMARNWMHVAMLTINGEKMGKSLGNFWTTRDVLEQFHPEAIRFFSYTTHYRHELDYSLGALHSATSRMVYLYDALARIDQTLALANPDAPPSTTWFDERGAQTIAPYMDHFDSAMANDFNTSLALSLLQGQAKIANDLTTSKKAPTPQKVYTLRRLRDNLVNSAKILALLQDDPANALLRLRDLSVKALGLDAQKIEALIQQRTDARTQKDWARADQVRDELLGMNVEIMDAPGGTSWRIRYAQDGEE